MNLSLSEFLDCRHMQAVMLSAITHRPSLPHRKFSWYSFLLETESSPKPPASQFGRKSMIPSGIEPETFWQLSQFLNQLSHREQQYALEQRNVVGVVGGNSVRSIISHVYQTNRKEPNSMEIVVPFCITLFLYGSYFSALVMCEVACFQTSS